MTHQHKDGRRAVVRVGRKLGKYKITRRIGLGGFATVYGAYDTIAGVKVALKVPHAPLSSKEAREAFRREVRLIANLDHPHILPVKDASEVDGVFIIVYALGQGTLETRLSRRLGAATALNFAEQMLDAVAYAHRRRIMHCDLKPENFITFPERVLRLTDFGIARVAQRTMTASGSGTVGYIAPEQAMGKPSLRSDVFSLGLILYRMFGGHLPEWPFTWPTPGVDRLKRTVHPDLIQLLRRSLEVDQRKRYADADRMYAAFKRIRSKALRPANGRKAAAKKTSGKSKRDWQSIRFRDFLKHYRKALDVRGTCHKCRGPVSERMQHCPWCGVERRVPKDETRFPCQCPRCRRGMKSDWRFCGSCYGPAVQLESEFRYPDVRYTAKCTNPGCPADFLMPFLRYCPWCRRKVKKKWRLEGSPNKCGSCGWGIAREYWDYCPWCGRGVSRTTTRRNR